MPRFSNLGDLIRRDRDLGKTAIIDLGGERSRARSATAGSTPWRTASRAR